MLNIVATLKAKKGSEADLAAGMKALVEKVKENEEGTLEYVLNQSVKDPCCFVVFESYKDKAALEFHGSTDYFKAFMKESGAWLAEKPVIEVCQEVARAQK